MAEKEAKRLFVAGNLQGPKGDKGDPGVNGYTPVKGVDYFTPDDKQELTNEVLNSLPEPLPDVTSDDNDKVLTVRDGVWKPSFTSEEFHEIEISFDNLGYAPDEDSHPTFNEDGSFTSNGKAVRLLLPEYISFGKTITINIKGTSDSNFRVWLGGGGNRASTLWKSADESEFTIGEPFDLTFELTAENSDNTGITEANQICFMGASYNASLQNLTITDASIKYGSMIDTEAVDGKSAYEIAVENGYEGTEEEWLASLEGADGSRFYYTSTPIVTAQQSWISPSTIEPTPTEIKVGDYIISTVNGKLAIVTNVGSSVEVKYLMTLKGDEGDPGQNGAIGPQGPAGTDGKTPVKGTDYFTETDKSEMVQSVIDSLPEEEVPYFDLMAINEDPVPIGGIQEFDFFQNQELLEQVKAAMKKGRVRFRFAITDGVFTIPYIVEYNAVVHVADDGDDIFNNEISIIININDANYIVSICVYDTDEVLFIEIIPVLPLVTTSDDGKFMRVVDGQWAAAAVPNAEEANF